MAAAVAGDGWRRRHDTLKMRLLSLLRWSGVEVDCEVFNIFSGLIPQQDLSRLKQMWHLKHPIKRLKSTHNKM